LYVIIDFNSQQSVAETQTQKHTLKQFIVLPIIFFYRATVASAVLAMEIWLGGMAGCLSHAGIVSKRL